MKDDRKVNEEPLGNDWLTAETEHARAVRFLVEQTDVSPRQAKAIVEEHGFNCENLLQIAHTMKAEG